MIKIIKVEKIDKNYIDNALNPKEIEEEVLKKFEEWREKGNWTSDNKAVKKAISLSLQKSQEMMREKIEKLINILSEFGYMEKEGYCFKHKRWENDCDCILSDNFLANYCETSDVAGAIKVLKELLSKIGGKE